MPKTLFGEKYVSLIVPDEASDVVDQGRRHHQAHRHLHRGREGAVRPLPAAAHGRARRAQPDAQRAGHRARGPRRPDRPEPRDRRQLPQAAQPADPRPGRGPPADRVGLQHVRRRAAPGRRHPAQHRHDHRHPRDPRGPPAPAPRRRHPVLRHGAHLPRRQRRQPDPARRGQPGPAPGAGALLDGVPVPARRRRQLRQARGGGVPRLHAAHRARDPAEPAARLHRRRQAGARRGPRTDLPAPAQPALEPVQPGPPPARLRRRHRHPDRQGHQPGRHVVRRRRRERRPAGQLRRLRRVARGVATCSTTCSPRRWAPRADQVPDLGGLLLGPMVRGATVSIGESGGDTP